MVDKGTNGALGGVASMHAMPDKLEVDLLCMHESFENAGAFIVKSLEAGA